MDNIDKIKVKYDKNIKNTIQVIDRGTLQIALVIDENNKLLGTVTDGDVRRAIINGVSLDEPVEKIMNKDFTSLPINSSKDKIKNKLVNENIKQLPLVDKDNHVIDLITIDDFLKQEKKDNPVVVMAGGLGTRLRPLTEDTPKPLLPVGEKPILEIILEQFIEYGFNNFIFCVNYKSDQIIEYFNDGDNWGVNINYVKEHQRMGTAGALSLIDEDIDKPFFVINGDLLTKLNFSSMMSFHENSGNKLTIGSRKYEYQIPYGVLDIEDNKVKDLLEKPTYTKFVNAGIYILEPDLIGKIPEDEFYDMTDLMEILMDNDENVGVFPVHEFWLDIGKHKDYKEANNIIDDIF